MRGSYRIAAVAAVVLAMAVSAVGQEKSTKDAAIAAAFEKAMTPGEGQKKLDFMVGHLRREVPDLGRRRPILRPRTSA